MADRPVLTDAVKARIREKNRLLVAAAPPLTEATKKRIRQALSGAARKTQD